MTNINILSFNNYIDSLDVAATTNILWPCNLFRVAIQKRGKNRLNIFEETILGLTDTGISDTEKLAELTCMDKAIIHFIQSKLSLRGFLDNQNNITDIGKYILDKKEKDEEKFATSAIILYDLANEIILPFVYTDVLEFKVITEIEEKKLAIFKPVSTKDSTIKAYFIHENNSKKNTIPKPAEFIKALRIFKNKNRRFSELTQNRYILHNIPDASAISINPEPTPVYLHCKAFIQKSNNDFVFVTDGFGFGYSDNFSKYLENSNWYGISKLKENALIEIDDNNTKEDNPNNKYISPIARRINDAIKSLNTAKKIEIESEAIRKSITNDLADAIANIYGALERTFTKYALDNGDIQYTNLFKQSNHEDNQELIVNCAKAINLLHIEKNLNLLKPKYGNIMILSEINNDMISALSLLILSAKYSENHLFHEVIKLYPDLLTIINKLKSPRDSILHGEIKNTSEYISKINNYLEIVINIIVVLLPDLIRMIEIKSDSINFIDAEKINQESLRASRDLNKYFGTSNLRRMNLNLKDLLHRICLIANQEHYTENSCEKAVITMYSALQIMYHEVILSADVLDSDNDESLSIKKMAFLKAFRNNLINKMTDIPESIESVPDNTINIVMQGKSFSLQTNLIVLLYKLNNKILKDINNKIPDFIKITAEIAELRKHGNIEMSIDDFGKKIFNEYKEKVFKIIKILMEVQYD